MLAIDRCCARQESANARFRARSSKAYALLAFVLLLTIAVAGGSLAGASTATANDAISGVDDAELAELVDRSDYDALRALGPAVMSPLARLYRGYEDPAARQRVAWAFYQLGFRSDEAAAALLVDVERVTEALPEGGAANPELDSLLISAQYALGRVGGDEAIVQVLLRNMRHGRSLRLRDKAACALAYDQVHLTPEQKALLYRGLIASLADSKLDVRKIASLALRIHTGQTKGYDPRGTPESRQLAIETWFQWLSEYEAQL